MGDYDCSDGVCKLKPPNTKQQLALEVYDASDTEITLQLLGTDSKYERYQVDMTTAAEEWSPLSKKISGSFLKKKGLQPGTAYDFRLRGLNHELSEWAPFSEVLKVETLSQEATKKRPHSVKVVSREVMAAGDLRNKMKVSWCAPIAPASCYALEYKRMELGESKWVLASDSIRSTEVVKKNLEQAKDWVFRVKAKLADGTWSSYSSPSAPVETVSLDPSFYNLFGNDAGALVRGSALTPEPLAQLSGKIIALYFSASWCPPCQQFTPSLVAFYNSMQQAKRAFEVVFVSADRDEGSFRNYFQKMPWLAIPYDNPKRTGISAAYQVQGIPRLMVFGPRANLLSSNAVQEPLTIETFDRWMLQA